MRRALIASVLFACVSAGCFGSSVEPLPFQMKLEVSKATTVTGDSLNFLVTAQGGNILGATIDFGDSSGDEFAASGARTAHITFRHAYSVTGTFDVKAIVTDAAAGQKDATIQVKVN